MIKHKVPQKWDLEVDLVAVGSSSGGLTAAVVGHDLGLKTAVLEKADVLGGGTALSGGVIWIPFNHHMAAVGVSDSREEALTYVRGVSMGHHDDELLAAYLDNGPVMLSYMEEHTPLKMTAETDGSRTDVAQSAHVPAGCKQMVKEIFNAVDTGKNNPVIGVQMGNRLLQGAGILGRHDFNGGIFEAFSPQFGQLPDQVRR